MLNSLATNKGTATLFLHVPPAAPFTQPSIQGSLFHYYGIFWDSSAEVCLSFTFISGSHSGPVFAVLNGVTLTL